MPSYSQEVLEDLRSGNDIVDVISQFVPLKQKGGSYFGLCPFHKENSPSFSVSADKQLYHCFGCGASGNVYGFIMRIENFSFVDAVKFLADRIHYTLPEPEFTKDYQKNLEQRNNLYDIHTKAARFFHHKLNEEVGYFASKYLDGRKVSQGARKKFGIGYSGGNRDELFQYLLTEDYDIELLVKSGLVLQDKKGGYFDRFHNRLMFPIFDVHNKVIGFGGRIMGDGQPKYLNSPDTPIFDKSRNLYSINYARQSKAEEIIVVEGYMDVISLYQSGFKNVTAALGTAFNIEHARLLKKYCKSVVLLFDSDEAGEKAALRAIPILNSSGLNVRVLQLRGAKDPDEFIKSFGAEAFAKAVAGAVHFTSFQVECIKKRYDLKDTAQKVQFAKEASVVIAALDNAIERDAYMKDIAKATGLAERALKEEVDIRVDKSLDQISPPKYKNKPNVVTNKVVTRGVDEAKRNILFVMATNAGLCLKIGKCILADELDNQTYIKLYDIIKMLRDENKSIVAADVISRFETVEEQEMISTIFAVQFAYDTELELVSALNDQIKVVKSAYFDTRISEELDFVKLAKLAELKKNLKNSYISNSDG